MIDRWVKGFIYFGMPAVAAYHLLLNNVFLNTAATDATGFEKAGNLLLTPMQYLCCGRVAVLEDGNYKFVQRSDYSSYWVLKTAVSAISCPLSVPIGSLIKGVGFLSEETRVRHAKINETLSSTAVKSNIDYYHSLGIPVFLSQEPIDPPKYNRRPGEELNLPHEKALMKEIVRLFEENQIPYWVDCGTCLGAYRYGGVIPWDGDVDMAILAPDFQNALNALNQLDPEKYQVQDWSNRSLPGTYIRVYIKENRNHLDIYHFSIEPEQKTVTSILSNESSPFMPESWKIRERRMLFPTPYEVIFPLRKTNFDGIEVCVPNQTLLYLQQRYGENIDPPKVYNENTCEYEKDLSHPYWQREHAN